MITFKDFINESDIDFDSSDFDDKVMKTLKTSGIAMMYTTDPDAQDDEWDILIQNNRPINKVDNFDLKKAKYEYYPSIRVKNNKFDISIQKVWYEGKTQKQNITKKTFSSENECLRFIVDYFKNEAKNGCFDKGKILVNMLDKMFYKKR